MRRLVAAVVSALFLVTIGTGSAGADIGVNQPVGSLPIPDGPAQAWVVADLDSGAVLAAKDEYARHPPASTIKVLLAQVALRDLDLTTVVEGTVEDENPFAEQILT